jgi:Tfp pilus assembly protein PilV
MRRKRGFTLIEASLTIIIIGVGVLSMLELMATGNRTHNDASRRTTGLTLARCLRERTLAWTFDQLRDHAGQTYSPPLDASGTAMAGFDDWQQTLQVQTVDPNSLISTSGSSTPSAVRVTAYAIHNNEKVQSLTWYRFAATE